MVGLWVELEFRFLGEKLGPVDWKIEAEFVDEAVEEVPLGWDAGIVD